jgi:hypothetical protein
VQQLTLSAGVARNTREIAFGGEAQQLRVQKDLQVPVELGLGWGGFMTLRYTGTFRTGRGTDPTGDTERDQGSHSLSVNSSFMAPAWLGSALARPVRLSYGGERECREVRFRPECVPFIDRINRALSVTLDTEVRGFQVGLQGSWNDRQSFVGQRIGSTQFQVSLFGQFLFQAGPPPASLRVPGG